MMPAPELQWLARHSAWVFLNQKHPESLVHPEKSILKAKNSDYWLETMIKFLRKEVL